MFYDYSRFEERIGNLKKAFKICNIGFTKVENYAPLWTQYVRLLEKLQDRPEDLAPPYQLEAIIEETATEAQKSLSSDLLWKLYIQLAEIYEKKSNFLKVKHYIDLAI